MNKKILTLVLVAALALTAVGGTMAYFTDTDAAKNVMTTGKVDIEQHEEQRYYDENDGSHKMVAFVQDKPLMPMVDTRETGDAVLVDGFFNEKMNNVVDKIVSVTNVAEPGAKNQDAYVRTILAFETNDEYFENTAEVRRDAKKIFNTYIGTLGSFDLLERDVIEIDGVKYVLAVKVYEKALAPGETSAPSLKQIFLSPDAGNEVALLFGEEYNILALSQAVQTAGFDSAEEALNTAFGDLDTIEDAKLIEWLSNVQ